MSLLSTSDKLRGSVMAHVLSEDVIDKIHKSMNDLGQEVYIFEVETFARVYIYGLVSDAPFHQAARPRMELYGVRL